MYWLEVSIKADRVQYELLCALLDNCGINNLYIDDPHEFSEFINQNREFWDYIDDGLVDSGSNEINVKFYLADNPSGHEQLKMVKNELMDFGELSVNGRNEEDWINNWKKYYKSFEIGNNIVIKPEWADYIDNGEKIVFNINPGSLFGTGLHETTQMCIVQLENNIEAGDKLLDMGCGSGILSIISLLLGAGHAVAVDIDPNAPEIAYANAVLNGISDIGKKGGGIFGSRYLVLTGNLISDKELDETISQERFDVITANIIADVIISLKEKAWEILNMNGIFICSGIIAEHGERVANELYDTGFEIIETEEKGEWVCITARKTQRKEDG